MDDETMQHADPQLVAELDGEVSTALGKIADGISELIALGDNSDILALGPERLVGFAQQFEAQRTRWTMVDSFIVQAAEVENLVSRTRGRSLAGALADILRISHKEATTRVKRAEVLAPESQMSSGLIQARCPALAEAVRAGTVSTDQTEVVTKAVRHFSRDPHIDTKTLGEVETALVGFAASLGPRDLQHAATRIDESLLPDGSITDPEIARARRGLHVGPERSDGTRDVSGRITRVLAAKMHAVLSPLSAPKPSGELGPDSRSADQRLHDGLEDAMDRLLASGTLPESGGTPATVHLVVDSERLSETLCSGQAPSPDQGQGNLGPRRSVPIASVTAIGTDGAHTRVTAEEVIALTPGFMLLALVFGPDCDRTVIGYGRSRRFPSKKQRLALIARDGGCSFPSCDAPSEWCQAHHIIAWIYGGFTELNNLTLLCGYHHREFLQRGWRVLMYRGRPTWVPPRYVDPAQRPQINVRIHIPGEQEYAEIAAEIAELRQTIGASSPPGTIGTPGSSPGTPGTSTESPDVLTFPDEEAAGYDDHGGPDPELLDDVTTILAEQVDRERRDLFQRELADLLDAYLPSNGETAEARQLGLVTQ